MSEKKIKSLKSYNEFLFAKASDIYDLKYVCKIVGYEEKRHYTVYKLRFNESGHLVEVYGANSKKHQQYLSIFRSNEYFNIRILVDCPNQNGPKEYYIVRCFNLYMYDIRVKSITLNYTKQGSYNFQFEPKSLRLYSFNDDLNKLNEIGIKIEKYHPLNAFDKADKLLQILKEKLLDRSVTFEITEKRIGNQNFKVIRAIYLN